MARKTAASAAVVFGVASLVASLTAAGQNADDKKPQVAMRASPAISFSPARVVVTAEIRGGANDAEEIYCPAVEWEWGDGTTSEAQNDCQPYEAGRSEIKRRYTAEHTFTTAGRYRVVFRLKRNNKTVLASNTSVQVRPGVREGWGMDQ